MTNTIVLKGEGIRKERIATTAVNPGHLVAITSTDGIRTHATAAGNAARAFAVENEIFGDGIDTAYAIGDRVLYEILPPGSEVQAKLAAAAAAVTRGDFLESAGNGTLRVLTVNAATSQAQRASVVAVALETINNSGGGTEVFIKVELL